MENGKLLSSLRSRINFPSRGRGVRGGTVLKFKIENGKWKMVKFATLTDKFPEVSTF